MAKITIYTHSGLRLQWKSSFKCQILWSLWPNIKSASLPITCFGMCLSKPAQFKFDLHFFSFSLSLSKEKRMYPLHMTCVLLQARVDMGRTTVTPADGDVANRAQRVANTSFLSVCQSQYLKIFLFGFLKPSVITSPWVHLVYYMQ